MMLYIAYFVLGFTALQLLIVGINLCCRQTYKKRVPSTTDLISILIPARNEEKNIGNILSDLQKQSYRHIEIIVFDDESTDKTSVIVREFQERDKRISLISSTGLPNDWLGKNYACHSLAQQAHGKYFLFLDADVRIGNHIIAQTLYQMQKYQLKLVSIFPKQMMYSKGEYLTVPLMNYILLTLLALVSVRKSCFSSMSAANGQYMFFDALYYQKVLPHQIMKSQKTEDIAIARYMKKHKRKIACWVGNHDITCRMYHSFDEAVQGFSKNIVSFFGNSYVLAFGFWIVTTFGFLPVGYVLGWKIVLLYFIAVVLIRICVSFISNQSVVKNILLLIPQQIVLGYIIFKSLKKKIKKEFVWKERKIFCLLL